mgnify:CR=1 FL=1
MARPTLEISMDETLTPSQQRVLQFIKDTIEETGMPPTRAEIAQALEYRSPNAAEEHLQIGRAHV